MRTPYLDWIISHLHVYEYSETYNYMRGDLVTIGTDLYESLSDHNRNNNPINTNTWNKIL